MIAMKQADPHHAAKQPPVGYDKTHFVLTMLWSADPVLASRADDAGIDRIGLDLEVLGKAERQKGLATWVSEHKEEQLIAMRQAIRKNKLFCRTNPIHDGSKKEIDRLISYGVDVLMLPMFKTVEEVRRFIDLINGRALAVPLLEHRCAADVVEEIVRVPGIDCLHVGLTDLALSLGVSNRFGLLSSDLIDRIADAAHGEGLRLCIGGIGRAMDNNQPVPADLIYAQYPRLGATGALISRAFFGKEPEKIDVSDEVRKCRQRMEYWRRTAPAALEDTRVQFLAKVNACQKW